MIYMQSIVRKSHINLSSTPSLCLINFWRAFVKMQMEAGLTESSHANVSAADKVSTGGFPLIMVLFISKDARI